MYKRANTSFGFGSGLTPLGRHLLIFYAGLYVLELVLQHWLHLPVAQTLRLYPYKTPDFHVWQTFTHPFVQNPVNPFIVLIDLLVLYFFITPLEKVLGTSRFIIFFYLAAFGGALMGLAFSTMSGFGHPFLGMTPSILAMVTVFGFIYPEATVLFMFILPIKARYISYATILITFFTFLAKVNPYGAYHLGGILAGYIYFRGPENLVDYRWFHAQYLRWKLKRQRRRFEVINGGKGKNDKKGPTYH